MSSSEPAALVTITEYTDPGCPFAWSSEPIRRRLAWIFGEQIAWDIKLVGLASSPDQYVERGFTPEKQAEGFKRLATRHHMPIDTTVRPRMAATVPACRAIVAVRLFAPEALRPFLRAVRVLGFGGELLDDPAMLRAAAADVGLSGQELEEWMASPSTEEALADDFERAREPIERALALSHKLAETESGYRYTCPSYEIERCSDEIRLAVPGFQPFEAYEVVLANLVPALERRPAAATVIEALEWADCPLATVEVAAVCDVGLFEAREALGRVATEQHLGFDGFWRLAA